MQETQETQVQPLGREDPLEEEMATQSNILAWRIPWIEEAGRLQSVCHKEWDTTEHDLACSTFMEDVRHSEKPPGAAIAEERRAEGQISILSSLFIQRGFVFISFICAYISDIFEPKISSVNI